MAAKGNKNALGNKGGGRKTLFKPEYCELAENYAYLGVTDLQLANFFKVKEKTIRIWKRTFPEFMTALKKGKEFANANVAKSLYQRAIGYSHPHDEIFMFKGKAVTVKTVKHYPPDTVACIYWLNNREPGLWKNRWDPDQNKNINVKIIQDGDNDK